MKKVLFLYHTSSIGGGSYCLLNILKNLDRDVINPCVLLSEDGPLVEEIKKLNIKVLFMPLMHVVPYNVSVFSAKRIKNLIEIYFSFSELKRIIKENRIDLVYCNSMMLYPYLKAAKDSDCKTIIHIREHWQEGEHSYQRNRALSHIAKYADEIIAINRYSANMIIPYGRQATIVYDWIDMDSRYESIPFDSVFGENMADKKVYLYLGGMQEIKGPLEVLYAFSHYIKDENSRLLVLGIKSSYSSLGFKGVIKNLLNLFGIKTYSQKVLSLVQNDSRIKCIPGNYNITHLYEQVYCVLSYFTIPHANLALAESVICNTVNVAARTDESLEYSAEGELALLFKENDFGDFLDAIDSLEQKHAQVKDMLARKSQLIKFMFDPQSNILRLNKIIEKVMHYE